MIKRKVIMVIGLCLIFLLNIFFINTVFAGENIKDLNVIITAEDGNSTVSVNLNYNLKITEDTKEIPLTGLVFSDTKIQNITANSNGRDLEVNLDQANPPGFSGVISLPEGTVNSDEISIILEYEIINAMNYKDNAFVLEAPLVIVNWKPETSAPGVFTSETIIPGEISIEEQFPTTPREVEVNNNNTHIAIGLQTPPSLVRLSGRKGDSIFFTYGRKVDTFVLLLLIIGTYYGYKLLLKEKRK